MKAQCKAGGRVFAPSAAARRAVLWRAMERPHDLPALPARPRDTHKGACGRVLIIGGSAAYPGAPLLAARAAFESGAGYVELAAPSCLFPALLDALPEAILHPSGAAAATALQREDMEVLAPSLGHADSVVLGPGLGPQPAETDWLPAWIAELQQQQPTLPLVIDADALNRLAAADALSTIGAQAILTPHPGEAARLLKLPNAAAVQADRSAALAALCARTAATVVLKGEGTLVGQRSGSATAESATASAPPMSWRNPSGNPGLATAGSGDVLAGLLGALLARGLSPWDAARLGVYLHGRAADLYAAEFGVDGLRASLLSQYLSRAMRADQQDTTRAS